MAEHPNAAVIRKMNEAMVTGDMQTASNSLADDVVWHVIGRAEAYRGKAELEASMGGFGETRITWETHDIVANDDHVVALGTATAMRGDEKLIYRTAEIYHVRNGQVAERWAFSDDTKAITDFFG